MQFPAKKVKVFGPVDNMDQARRKNIVGEQRLLTELQRIDREQLAAMRMHKYAQIRFKNKYYKQKDSKKNEAAEVVMYETHNPGFCYRRNGECRLQGSCIINSPVNMQDLRKLLFTNGEIDIDKVLCLYLLTAHKSETLRLPPKTQQMNFLTRQHSPLERLIERSKKRSIEHELLKILPLYILELPTLESKKPTEKDPRLANRIMVNTRILHIIKSVKTALDQCNTNLLDELIHIAHHKEMIQAAMSKPHMVAYFKTLYGQNIISSCESFQLELFPRAKIVPFKLDIEPLEELVKVMRNHILLIPNSDTWKSYNASMGKIKDTEDPNTSDVSKDLGSIGLPSTSESCSLAGAGSVCTRDPIITSASKKSKVKIIKAKTDIRAIKEDDFCLPIGSDEEEEEVSRMTMVQKQPKIMKNLQRGFSEYCMEEEEEQQPGPEDDALSIEGDGLSLDVLANLLNESVKKEIKMEYRNRIQDLTPPMFLDNNDKNDSATTTTKDDRQSSGTHSVRTAKCEACLNRWKQPLPTPKISQLKKFPLPELEDTSYFSSKRARRISKLIDQEVKKLEEIEKQSAADRASKKPLVDRSKTDISIEIIYVDEMELAKIRQEIKEKETAKKLKEFLDAKHC